MAVTLFDGNDQAYMHWLSGHPDGFVVNSRRIPDSDYLVLHRATCGHVNSYAGMKRNPGGFTERSYVKYCADSIAELAAYLGTVINSSRPFSKACSVCKPE